MKYQEPLCRKWAIEILKRLSTETSLNYTAIESSFDTSSDVITDRLVELEEVGLIKRREQNAIDVRYGITDEGERVLSLLQEIEQIIDK